MNFTFIWITILCTYANFWSPVKGCTEVPESKCGTDWFDSCLKCGTKSEFDCEQCCPNCKPVSKDNYRYCECGKGPTPKPGPPAGNDTWSNYEIAGMQVMSVVGGKDASNYQKVVIMLHGGGEDGTMWEYQYEQGWFGSLDGMKYVFPTSAYPSHVWYQSYKNGCGLLDDCAYNISSIQEAASWVAALIEHEKSLVGGDASNVYLAGFSQGAQLTGYMQLCKLDYALGGVIVMDGFPLPPLVDMPGHPSSEAKKNATYYGNDMRWMIWNGEDDSIFPVDLTMNTWHNILDVLAVSSTLKISHREPNMGHTLIKSEFDQMVDFIHAATKDQRRVTI